MLLLFSTSAWFSLDLTTNRMQCFLVFNSFVADAIFECVLQYNCDQKSKNNSITTTYNKSRRRIIFIYKILR